MTPQTIPARAPARAAPDRPPGRALLAPPRSVAARASTLPNAKATP